MKKYRVEAFIIPSVNKDLSDSNQIDDVKLAIKLKDQSFTSSEGRESDMEEGNDSTNGTIDLSSKAENDVNSVSGLSDVFFDLNEHIYDEIILPERRENKKPLEKKVKTEYTKAFFKVDEPIYDEPFVGNLANVNSKRNYNYDVPQTRWTLANSKFRRFGIVAPKLPKRSSSLMSITEDIESFDETLQDICCHGRKNGCLPNTQRPEDISDDIFKENWMQKLNSLRKLETLLKDKEVALQSRERLLFKKEKELRILERLVKDKMKQAELYAKRYKKASSSESIANNERNLESRSSNGSKERIKSTCTSETKSDSKLSLDSNNERIFKIPPNSLTSERLSSRIGSVRSRSKPRQKVRYDDLDSTLSADIGDASFVVTSQKFDPGVFKKPAAFARSASERKPRTVERRILTSAASMKLNCVIKKNEYTTDLVEIIEEKTLEKISKNILASQDQSTKFLNYGLIDEKTVVDVSNTIKKESDNHKRFSYLNLESGNKIINQKPAPNKARPVSWNEDACDWLKEKRQAYNLSTRKLTNETVVDKENLDKTKLNKSSKVTKKKEKPRKFSIFR